MTTNDTALDDAEFSCLALRAAAVGAWRWDSLHGAVRLSAEAAALLGCRREDVRQLDDLTALIDATDRDRVAGDLIAAAGRMGRIDTEFRTARTGAAASWVKALGSVGAADAGAAVAHGVLIDIGGRKTAEDANSRLAAIVTSSDDAIIGKTLDGVITDWNRGAEAIYGFSAAEMVGRSIAALLPPGQEDELQGILQRIRQGERVEHFETRRRCKDGGIIDVSITVSPVYDEAGRLLGASKVARDITLTKRADAALRQREAYLQSVLETVPEAMVVIDTEGTIQSFNRTAERIFGYAAREAVGENATILMQPCESQRHNAHIRRYLTTGEARVIGHGRLDVGRRKDGSAFPLEISVGEMRTGEDRYFISFIRDVSERETARRRVQDLQSELIHLSRLTAMGEMASALAHEINQPLTAITSTLNGIGALLSGPAATDPMVLREAVADAASEALRAGEIIRRLRNFVARKEVVRGCENLAAIVEETCALALIGAREGSVRATVKLDGEAVFVLADRIQIQQVLLNLIRNAVEAMADATRRELGVTLRRLAGGMAEIAVSDSGPGIAPDIAGRLFQPFATTKPTGMGIGLSLSRTIAEAHGGRLTAEPQAGGGTIFRLVLPLAEPAGDAA